MFSGNRVKSKECYTRWLASVLSNNVGLEDPVFRERAERALQEDPMMFRDVQMEVAEGFAESWRESMAPFDKPMEHGLSYRLKVDNKQFIITYIDAEIAYRVGTTTRQALGKKCGYLYPDEEILQRLHEMNAKAWLGMDVIFFGYGLKPNSNYRVHLKREGDELVGRLEFMDRYKLDDDIVNAKTVDLQSYKKKKPPVSEILRPHMFQPLTEYQMSSILVQLNEMQGDD